MNVKNTCAIVIAGSALWGYAAPALADTAADFYRGKQVVIHVGFSAGGGYDASGRLFARFFGKHMAGNPSVIVQNTPGGGSLKLANYLYNAAPKDGTQLGMISASVTLEPLFGNKQAKYEPQKFAWIGSLLRDSLACGVWNGAGVGIKSLPDMIASKKTVLFGSTGPAAPTGQHPMFLKNVFGANLRVIHGYKGTSDVNLAMQTGEVHASCGMWESTVKGPYAQYIRSGDLKIFVQFAAGRKIAAFGDATPMYDLLKSEDDRKVADLIFGQGELARPLAAPPGTPADRFAALRKAMLDTLKDPGLVAEAAKSQIDFDPVPGDEMDRILDGFMKTPPDLVRRARELTQPEKS